MHVWQYYTRTWHAMHKAGGFWAMLTRSVLSGAGMCTEDHSARPITVTNAAQR